jgi:hypothetical protein
LKRLICIFGIVLFSYQLHAQKKYIKGLVVLFNGDTLHGWIDYRNWKVNPKAINFKSDSLSEDHKKFTVEDLSYFEVKGFDVYRKAIVKKDVLPVDLPSLTTISDSIVTDTVFLRAIVQGKFVNLFELVDFKPHYYIQDSSTKYTELVYKRYLHDDNINLITRNIYRNQLIKYATDQHASGKLLHKIENLGYNAKELGSMVAAINKLSGEISYASDYNKNSEISYFAGVGTVYTGIKFNGPDTRLTGMDFKNTISPLFTAGVNVYSPRNLRDLVLRFELSYHSAQYKGNKTMVSNFPTLGGDTLEYVIKQNNITPAVSVLYNLVRNEKHRYYIGAQYGITFSSYPTNRLTIWKYNGKSVTEEYLVYKKSWTILNIKTGIEINRKWEIGLTGRVAGSFVNYTNISAKPTMYTLWVGYHIK